MGKKIKKVFKSVAKVVTKVADPLGVVTGDGILGGKEETVLAAPPAAQVAETPQAPKANAATQGEIDAEIERKRKEKGAALAQSATGTVGQPLGTKTMLGG